MITTYITNANFRTRIEQATSGAHADNKVHLYIPSLDAEEVNIHPGEHIPQVIAFTSTWIDLDSEVPLFAHVSRQVLAHELEYAAFCGVSTVVIEGPKRKTNVAQYAQIIHATLLKGSYTQIHIHLPMAEEEGVVTNDGEIYDEFSMWDVWNTIRTVCKYNARLSLGTYPPALKIRKGRKKKKLCCRSLTSNISTPSSFFVTLPPSCESLVRRTSPHSHYPLVDFLPQLRGLSRFLKCTSRPAYPLHEASPCTIHPHLRHTC